MELIVYIKTGGKTQFSMIDVISIVLEAKYILVVAGKQTSLMEAMNVDLQWRT